jgi:hypothetical protein
MCGWLVGRDLSRIFFIMDEGCMLVQGLNANPHYDLTNIELFQPNDDLNDNPYANVEIDSLFYDNNSFRNNFASSRNPIILNINIQSLQSKFENLKNFLLSSLNDKIPIDIIALHEIWQISDPNSINIPGFSFVYIQREIGRGGDVGFYINNKIQYKLLETPTPFISKKFESLTIVINVNKKKFLCTNIYRPPTPIPGVSSNEQLKDFVLTMDQILSNFSNMTILTIILTDSNINLLKPRDNPITEQFANTVHSNGFLFVQCKATRQNQGHLALIDHIITNHKFSQVSSGVLIEDLSDHFPNFIQLPLVCAKPKCDSTATRAFTPSNITTFQNNLTQIGTKFMPVMM